MGRQLVGGLFIRKGRLELLLPGGVRRERDARPGFARRVDLEQLLGDVLNHLARAPSRARPITSAEPVQRRLVLTAEKFLDAVEVLDRHEQLVGLGVIELQVLAMGALGFEQTHAGESRDPVVDVDDQLAGREVERELAGQLLGAAARRASGPRGTAKPAEELGIGDEVEAHRRLNAARRDVDVGVPQGRFELEVEIELDLPQLIMNSTLVEQCPQPLGLLGGDHDGRRRCVRGELGGGFRPAHHRLRLSPTKVDGVVATFARREFEMRMALDHLQPLGPDHRQHESARKLIAFGFCGREHLGFLDEHARIRQLPAGLEINDRHPLMQVLQQRWHRLVKVGRVELDAGEGATCREPFDLLLPVRPDIGSQAVERHAFADAVCRRGPAPRSQQKLTPRVDRNPRHRHHRALVGGVEQPQRLDGVTRPLGTHRRIGRSRIDVEDPSPQRELPVVLDQLLARIAHLDQPGGSCDRIGARAWGERQRAEGQICGRDRRSNDGAARRNDDDRRRTVREGVQGLHPLVDRVVERRRPVEERNRDLSEDVCRRPAGEPGPQVVAEAIRRRRQDEE
jgi:hypothetical protein